MNGYLDKSYINKMLLQIFESEVFRFLSLNKMQSDLKPDLD